jgi:hypothetical protein
VISPAEMAGLRATVAGVLPSTCTVSRPTGTSISDGAGGWEPEWGDVPGLVGVACAVAPVGRGAESTFGGRIVDQADAVVTFAGGADVRTSDRVTATITDPVTGLVSAPVYEVIATSGARSIEPNRRVAVRQARP